MERHRGCEERSNFDVGYRLWGAALVLASMVDSTFEAMDFGGRDVLEIGAGLGLPGLLVAQLPSPHRPSRVTLSDYSDKIARNLDWAIALNGADDVAASTKIDWDDLDGWTDDDAGSTSRHYDIILGSDLICQKSDCEGVARLLDRFLAPSADAYALIVLGSAKSRWGVDAFAPAIAAVGRLEIVASQRVPEGLVPAAARVATSDDNHVGTAHEYLQFKIRNKNKV